MESLQVEIANQARDFRDGRKSLCIVDSKLILLFMVITFNKSKDQPGKVANPARSRLRIWSREMCSAVPSRVNLHISLLRLNRVLTYGIPPEFRGGVHLFKPPYAIGSVPSLSVHYAIAYRWRSLPRVRRRRASKPQGSSKRVLP